MDKDKITLQEETNDGQSMGLWIIPMPGSCNAYLCRYSVASWCIRGYWWED